ncbi:hypothetical protein AMTRI_Chr04g252090 [Amborella trichopoda]
MRYLYNDYGLTAKDALESLSVTISSRGQILFPIIWDWLYKLVFSFFSHNTNVCNDHPSLSKLRPSLHRNIEGPHFVDPGERSKISVTSHMFVKRPTEKFPPGSWSQITASVVIHLL